jgi:hypothetical protein
VTREIHRKQIMIWQMLGEYLKTVRVIQITMQRDRWEPSFYTPIVTPDHPTTDIDFIGLWHSVSPL